MRSGSTEQRRYADEAGVAYTLRNWACGCRTGSVRGPFTRSPDCSGVGRPIRTAVLLVALVALAAACARDAVSRSSPSSGVPDSETKSTERIRREGFSRLRCDVSSSTPPTQFRLAAPDNRIDVWSVACANRQPASCRKDGRDAHCLPEFGRFCEGGGGTDLQGIGPANERSVLVTVWNGSDMAVLSDNAALLRMFGLTDTPSEAAWIAWFAGFNTSCAYAEPGLVRQAPDGYELIAVRERGCMEWRQTCSLHVDRTGKLDVRQCEAWRQDPEGCR